MPTLAFTTPAYGSLRVGSYTFNNFTETDVDIHPVKSMDGRAVVFSEIVIHFRAWVAQESVGLAQAEIDAAIPSLQKSGVPIVYSGRGFDRLLASLGYGRVQDVAWGPVPQSVRVKPRAAPSGAWRIDFAISAKVPFCRTARFEGPIDLAATVSFQPDYSGLVTRTWAGRLRIVNNLRADGRGGFDSPDLYREDVVPDLLPNFYREWGPFVTSEDRTELRFEVRDVQRASRNVPPPYIVGKPKCGQRVVSTKKGLRTWIEYFTGEYELSPDAPDIYVPARHFFEVYVGGRIEWLRKALGNNTKDGGPQTIIPISVEMGSDNDFDRPIHTFSCALQFTCGPESVINASGLWRAIKLGSPSPDNPVADWGRYERSLLTSAFSPWGVSQIYLDVEDDQLLGGLCGVPPEVSAGGNEKILRAGRGFDIDEWFDNILRTIQPKTSWVDYENKLTIIPESGNVEIRTLPVKELPDAVGTAGAVLASVARGFFDAGETDKWSEFDNLLKSKLGGAGSSVLASVIGAANGAAAAVAAFQQRVPDRFKVVMEGHALRAKFEIPPPTLTEIGGVEAVAMYDRKNDYLVPSKVVRDIGGVPLYASAWRLTFMPKTFPLKKPIEPLPNPMIDPE